MISTFDWNSSGPHQIEAGVWYEHDHDTQTRVWYPFASVVERSVALQHPDQPELHPVSRRVRCRRRRPAPAGRLAHSRTTSSRPGRLQVQPAVRLRRLPDQSEGPAVRGRHQRLRPVPDGADQHREVVPAAGRRDLGLHAPRAVVRQRPEQRAPVHPLWRGRIGRGACDADRLQPIQVNGEAGNLVDL